MKAALVTGATGVIGSEIVVYLAKNGWDVGIHYMHSEEKAQALFQEVLKYGVKAYLIKANLLQLDELSSIFQHSDVHYELLINNASVFINDRARDFSSDNLELNMKIHHLAPAILSQYFVMQLPEYKNGNLINMLDYGIFKTPHNFFSYHNSKAALAYLTKISARQYAPNVRVNGIAIGRVSNRYPSDHSFIEASPLKIMTPMSNIEATINFILQIQSMTGQIITLDSGMHLADSVY